MARLSAENSIEHLAALKTPDQKGSRKSNRFKDFFKGSNSRASLSSGHNMSPPGASPTGGVENFKPGFEKVGLHPSERSPGSEELGFLPPERSRTLDLDEWEKLKEENKEMGHMAKMRLYKEREEMRKREGVEGENDVEGPQRERSRDESVKAMEVPGIEGDLEEGLPTADIAPAAVSKEAASPTNIAQEQERDYAISAAIEALEETIHDVCEGSTSVDDLRASAQNQVLPDESILNIGDPLEYASIRANASESNEQQISDAIARHEFRFHRFRVADVDSIDPRTSTARRTRSSKIAAELEGISNTVLPAIRIFKIGPCQLEDTSATRTLRESFLPLTYCSLFFFKAMQGPSEFFVALWKMCALALAYNGLGKLLGWHEDGSSDVLLAPAEDLAQEVKRRCLEMMTTLLQAFAQAIAVAMRELDVEDDD
ncbi:uncharacterized protein N0V89_008008 [Didymosphaeria variabile]|uniref:Uncharacterized protein n=1 Tax=Didymosphaeria variabile TaxID=1932322 RepID=A0A9W8XFL3_9PLEO|nr:uncharacterized protein N0V89_008008 [Didymosphaeria variabile]KAJ4349393.1 hypothetical protein N0V89_008008 [Didymosphaeria variabile]